MQEVATSFFMKCRDAGFPAYPSNAMWFGCSKKSLNGGVVGLERGGHQFMGRRTPVYGSCIGVHRPGMCAEA